MSGPLDFLDPYNPMAGQLMAYGQPDPFQDQDPIRFLGRVQAEAVDPEFADLARASQEVPTPNDYWARVAQGAGPQPFGPMQLGPKPTGLEVLLALASGFANAKAGQGARRVSEADQANARAREAAKTLAQRRHDMRKIAAQAKANKELIGERAAYANPPAPEALENVIDPKTGRPKKVPRSQAVGMEPAYPPQAPVVTLDPSGKPVYTTRTGAIGKGAPGAADKPSTQAEKRSLAFYDMARNAHEFATRGEPGKTIEDRMIASGVVNQAQMHKFPNLIKTPEQRQLVQAQKQFTEARLRPVSGAAIRPDEYVMDAQMFWGQLGDDPATLERKRQARAVILDGLKFQSGKAYSEKYGGSSAGSTRVLVEQPDGTFREE